MKKMLFESNIDLEKRKKNFAVHSKTEDEECKTQVQKSFTYVVDQAKETEPESKEPIVFIRKSFDTKRQVENFSFHVKGYFHITHNDALMKVIFNHTLDIKINWKAKDFSPKKSASLT